MSRYPRHSVLLMCVSFLGACAVTGQAPAPVEDRINAASESAVKTPPALPGPPPATSQAGVPVSVRREQHPAVTALLASAREDLSAGRYASAGATTERALRVDPKDPWVWQTLARVHFSNGDYDQARVTAERSNALASTMSDVLAANWNLIAEAERRRGDVAASELARQQADRYERLPDAVSD